MKEKKGKRREEREEGERSTPTPLDLAGEESDPRTARPDSIATLGKTLVVGLRAVCGCVVLRAVT